MEKTHRLKIATTSTGGFDLYFRNPPSNPTQHIMKDDFSSKFFSTGCSGNDGGPALI